MGDFEMLVTLDEGEDFELPPPEPITVVPDHIEQLVTEDEIKPGVQLLDEEELTGDNEFRATLFGEAAAKVKPEEVDSEKVDERPHPFLPQPAQGPITADQVIDAFLESMGIDRCELHASTDPLELMANAGRVLQAFVTGVTALLVCRANLKSMFRLDETTVLPRHNNPIKMSESARDSLMQLLVGKEGEYMGPLDALN